MMRKKFEKKLNDLKNEIITMGSYIEHAIIVSIKALYDGDNDLAQEVIELEEQINEKERDIQAVCTNILLTEQPVSNDLRFISSALKMVVDMERIGDQAYDIAEIALSHHISYKNLDDSVKLMAEETIDMVKKSINAFVNNNITIAKEVIVKDDIIDDLFIKNREKLIDTIKSGESSAEQALDIFMAVKYLERIADHSVNISEALVYAINGDIIKG